MSAATTGTKNVREVRDLQFKDGSHYAGQALEGYTGTLPYGYGEMRTKEGFCVRGLFKDGSAIGAGIFTAPNGDVFYGQWNKHHKRHGQGLSIRASDGVTCVESYNDGALLKKVKRRPPAASTLHWLPPLGMPGTDERHTFTGDVPMGHSGHSLSVSRDGGLVVLFGGEVATKDSHATQLSADVYMLDVKSRVWVKPTTTGTVPPPMTGHTATLVGRNLIIIGGQLGGIEANSSVFVLDIETGIWSCPIHKGLSFMNHTATLIGKDTIWVILQSSVFVLSFTGGHYEWREVETDNRHLPRHIPRSFVNHTAVAVGTMIYVHGGKWLGISHGEGKKYERLSGVVRILHTETLRWEAPACSAPVAPSAAAGAEPISDYSGFVRGSWDVPRCEHTATLVGDLMYIIGGFTTSNPAMNVVDTSYLNDVQILNVATMAWQHVPSLPIFIAPRSLHAVIALQNELWTYGGRNSASTTLADWSILHLPQTGAAAAAAPPVKKAAAPMPAGPAAAAAAPTAVAPSGAPTVAPASVSASVSASASTSDLIDESSAGSGSIMDAFLRG